MNIYEFSYVYILFSCALLHWKDLFVFKFTFSRTLPTSLLFFVIYHIRAGLVEWVQKTSSLYCRISVSMHADALLLKGVFGVNQSDALRPVVMLACRKQQY